MPFGRCGPGRPVRRVAYEPGTVHGAPDVDRFQNSTRVGSVSHDRDHFDFEIRSRKRHAPVGDIHEQICQHRQCLSPFNDTDDLLQRL